MIQVTDLKKSYGPIQALGGVTFEIAPGEIVGLLGPNGAGKTTIIKMLTGYLQPDEGLVMVDGLDVLTHTRQVQAEIGYLPETAPLYPELSVQAYLLMMAELRQIPEEERIERLSEAVYATGLNEHLTRPIGQLSKGFRQRVGLAQAILHRPRLLILDEPTIGLDPTQIVEIRRLIRRLAEHSTVLFSTHILSEVEALCDRVIILMNGQIKADARLSELAATSDAILVLGEETPEVSEPTARSRRRERGGAFGDGRGLSPLPGPGRGGERRSLPGHLRSGPQERLAAARAATRRAHPGIGVQRTGDGRVDGIVRHMMKQALSITRKELNGYFGSPMALIFVGAFLAATLFSFFWVETFFARGIADVRPLFRWMPVLMIFLVAALTMRQWSEEQRSGTLEILLTLPVSPVQLVLGKFLAVLALVGTALALTLFLPITVALLGNLDWGPVIGGYLAAFCWRPPMPPSGCSSLPAPTTRSSP